MTQHYGSQSLPRNQTILQFSLGQILPALVCASPIQASSPQTPSLLPGQTNLIGVLARGFHLLSASSIYFLPPRRFLLPRKEKLIFEIVSNVCFLYGGH